MLRSVLPSIFAGVIATMGFATTAQAQASATATANASANIVEALSLVFVQDLLFGAIVSGSIASNVTVTPAGGITLSSGNATLLGGHQQARFQADGELGRTITITLPAGSITIVEPGLGATMTVGAFTSTPSGTIAMKWS